MLNVDRNVGLKISKAKNWNPVSAIYIHSR